VHRVLSLIADANQLPDAERAPVIQTMLQRVDKIEFLLRVCNDERLISTKVWADAIDAAAGDRPPGRRMASYSRKKAPVA
jgi:hypothetical protein